MMDVAGTKNKELAPSIRAPALPQAAKHRRLQNATRTGASIELPSCSLRFRNLWHCRSSGNIRYEPPLSLIEKQ